MDEIVQEVDPPGRRALALDLEAVKAGKSAYFTTLGEFVGGLAKAEREDYWRGRIKVIAAPPKLCHTRLPNVSQSRPFCLSPSDKDFQHGWQFAIGR